MLITLGVLLSIDHFGTISFGRTWPVLLIVFGLFKLAQRSTAGNSIGGPPPGSSGSIPQ